MKAAIMALPFVAAAGLLAAGLIDRSGGPVRQALAEADAGTYAIAIRDDGTTDTVLAVNADSGDVLEVAELEHLHGYASYGAVSPDGTKLAAVVADAGTPARPVATLHIVDLQSSSVSVVLDGIDQLQQPIWSPDGAAVIVTRTAATDGPATTVTVLRVDILSGSSSEVMQLPGVAGAYPVGFDANGRLLVAAIERTGTTLYREAGDSLHISNHLTRDWQVAPDGTQLAFVEANVEQGLRYSLSVISLVDGAAQAQTAQATGGQQLGVAWHPAGDVTAGQEPDTGAARGASGGAPGFDIPLEYSPDGAFLAVEAWTGTSFEQPGAASLQIIGDDGRTDLPSANRFVGWAVR